MRQLLYCSLCLLLMACQADGIVSRRYACHFVFLKVRE